VPRLNYTVDQLKEKALDVRRDVVTALVEHPVARVGSALAGADLLTTLLFYEVNFKLDDPDWVERDMWHVSSQALTPALHAAMAEVGFFPTSDLASIGSPDHHLEGFPSSRTPGVEVSGGPPGAGLSVALGMALASRLDGNPRRIYCVMDDSEIQSGQLWEAAMAAAQFELGNLVLVIDLDGHQADGEIEEIIGLVPLAEKMRDFNWHVLEVDGNDVEELVDAFNRSRSLHGAPAVILSCTVHGHGVALFEESDEAEAAEESEGAGEAEAEEAAEEEAGEPAAAPGTSEPSAGVGDRLTSELAGRALAELGTTLDDWRHRLEPGEARARQAKKR
jgi:transketolase